VSDAEALGELFLRCPGDVLSTDLLGLLFGQRSSLRAGHPAVLFGRRPDLDSVALESEPDAVRGDVEVVRQGSDGLAGEVASRYLVEPVADGAPLVAAPASRASADLDAGGASG
jgi:hypothetical protein